MKIKKLTLAVIGFTAMPAAVLAQGVCDTGNCENASAGQVCVGSVPVGVVVSTEVRDAMQESIDAVCVGSDSLVCMPGISSAEFNRLVSGTVNQWVSTGLAGIGALGANERLGTCGISSNLVSGQAAQNKVGVGFAPNTGEGTIAAVTACLPRAPGPNPIFPSTSKIGVLPVSELATDDYKFIKLDGVAPLLAEHMSANYNLIANHSNGAATYSQTEHIWGVAGGASLASGAPCKMTSAGSSSPGLPAVAPGAIQTLDTPK